jgi:hypothetical protein
MPVEPVETAPLNPNDILQAEFTYIAQTAFQANEDRARVTNFYLVTLGGFIAALVGTHVDSSMTAGIYWAFAALFVVLFAASVLTLLQLVRLRWAWFDSVRAMNAIKSYYEDRFPDLALGTALVWKKLPRAFNPWSVGFLLALQVALLGGASAGAAVICAGLTWKVWPWGWAAAAFLVGLLAQMAAYWWLLKESDGTRSAQQAETGVVTSR